MDIWYVLLEILGLLGASFMLGALAERLGQSAIIGYLAAGVILGPWLLTGEAVAEPAELGVALLLFSIGLEFSLAGLKRLGRVALWGGAGQVVATMALFTALLATARPLPEAVSVGAMLALSSTAVVLRVLRDRAELDSVHGRNALGILLTQDIAVVPLVLTVTMLTEGGGATQALWTLARTLGAAATLVAIFYLLFNHGIPRLLLTPGLARNRELVILLAIVVALGSAWSAHALGLSPALGAFLAGMLLAESPFAVQIRADVGTLRTVFVTLFFTSIGMLAKPAWITSHALLVLAATAAVFAGKTLVTAAIIRLLGGSSRSALATGIGLGQVGEFSFVLAAVAHQGGALSGDAFDLIVSVTIVSLFLAPYMVAYADAIAARFTRTTTLDGTSRAGLKPGGDRPDVIVVGYGPADRAVALSIRDDGGRPLVLEQNPVSVARAVADGFATQSGDASAPEVLDHAGLSSVGCLVVTLPDPRTAANIIAQARRLSPELRVVARSRYHIHGDDLKRAGADAVVDEEERVGEALAAAVRGFQDGRKT